MKIKSKNKNHDYETLFNQSFQPTTTGEKVRVRYEVLIELIYNTFSSENPKCLLPICIQSPEFHDPSSPTNPKVYDDLEYALPVESKIPSSKTPLLEEEKSDSSAQFQASLNYLEYPQSPSHLPSPKDDFV